MITIIDYGLGNIRAFVNVYERMNIDTRIARSADDLKGATRLILPGVGTFDHAMELLNASGMRAPLTELVQDRRVPVLGVCVGMQILAESSEEGSASGLGWINARVLNFGSGPDSTGLPTPHMGWNDIEPVHNAALFSGLETGARFYFLHSYYVDCPDVQAVAARADYGVKFACSIRRDNVFGVQFHPEKSHRWGARLLKNFAEAA
jgi:glutamine amidotransferase